MALYENVGITETYEETHIQWKIPDISSIEDCPFIYMSPYFIVCDGSWKMVLHSTAGSDFEILRLYIDTDEKREYVLECTFSLKKSDGSTEQLVNTILNEYHTRSKDLALINRSDLRQRKSELTPQNVLTIICSLKPLKREFTYSIQRTAPYNPITLELIGLYKLSENFKDLFGETETCDVTLNVKDKEYKAHRSVLIARSSVFAATFKHDTLERQTGVITIPDCDPDSFQKFLEYIYCGRLEQLSVDSALNLYYTSKKYVIEELKAFCVDCLMQCLAI